MCLSLAYNRWKSHHKKFYQFIISLTSINLWIFNDQVPDKKYKFMST